jgi:hypothetical protein
MRNIADKVDSVSTLSAAEFNASIMQELENTVTNAGITLDGAAGPDTNDEMLAQAITRTAQGALSYTDGGAADAYVLTASGGFVQPSAYTDGMIVTFQAGNTNTGASTVNVSGIGVTDLKDKDGTALAAGAVAADDFYIAQYNLANTEFRVIFSTSSSGSSTVASGYQEVAGGLILQWGVTASVAVNAVYTYSFNLTFPNNALFVGGNLNKAITVPDGTFSLYTSILSTSQFQLVYDRATTSTVTPSPIFWFALGN